MFFCYFFTVFRLSPLKTTVDPQKRQESIPGDMLIAMAAGSAHSPRSEAVTNELQELSLQPAPSLLPLRERKNGKAAVFMKKMCDIYAVLSSVRPFWKRCASFPTPVISTNYRSAHGYACKCFYCRQTKQDICWSRMFFGKTGIIILWSPCRVTRLTYFFWKYVNVFLLKHAFWRSARARTFEFHVTKHGNVGTYGARCITPGPWHKGRGENTKQTLR